MTKEQIMAKMDKLYNRLDLYVKKSEKMGLEEEEEEKYYSMFGEYLKLKLRLGDLIFDQHILSELLYGEAAKLRHEMIKNLKWNTALMIDEEQMAQVILQYANLKDKKLTNDMIEDYYVELMTNLEKYMEDKSNFPLIKEVGKLLAGEQDDFKDVLRGHMDYKFEVLYMLLAEGEQNEKTC